MDWKDMSEDHKNVKTRPVLDPPQTVNLSMTSTLTLAPGDQGTPHLTPGLGRVDTVGYDSLWSLYQGGSMVGAGWVMGGQCLVNKSGTTKMANGGRVDDLGGRSLQAISLPTAGLHNSPVNLGIVAYRCFYPAPISQTFGHIYISWCRILLPPDIKC